MSGVCWADDIVVAIDQIFSLAVWIRSDMLPVVSSTNTTSIFGLAVMWCVIGSTGSTGWVLADSCG